MISRREFGQSATGTALAAGLLANTHPQANAGDEPKQASNSSDQPLNVGIIGMGGRGNDIAKTVGKIEGAYVTCVCDVDQGKAESAADNIAKAGKAKPKIETDFRALLADKSIQAVFVTTANHWHAPLGILAVKAGKHAYVEKPISHNPYEGEVLVAEAAKANRLVQMGNQRRSWPKIVEGIELVRKGAIGKCHLAFCYYHNKRQSIGKGKVSDPPKGFNFDLWQGPAPRQQYRNNIHPYNWHWFWAWGNGELGNNGVHMIDLCRWALDVKYPIRVTSSGGRYHFDDDQETPDSNIVNFEFADEKLICWEGLSCNPTPNKSQPDCLFIGEKGSLAIKGTGYTQYDLAGKEVKKSDKDPDGGSELIHLKNFFDAINGKAKLNSPASEGHLSTLLCHLGNISYRTRMTLEVDDQTGKPKSEVAMRFWKRDYDPAWEKIIFG